MSFDVSSANRYAMDQVLAVPSILGVAEYSVYVVQVVNDQVAFDDPIPVNRVLTETRLLMADGYLSYAAGDGYLNPIVTQEFGENLVLSNGQLTDNIIRLGPLVFPYTYPIVLPSGAQTNFNGGIDPTIFQPPIGSNNNIQINVQIRGLALSPNSNFFDVKEMQVADMANLSYYMILSANSRVVS